MISETCRNYLKQAWKNEGLVLFIDNNCATKKFFNWIFVVIFYTALHYFYAFLESKGEKIPTSHKSKNKYDLGGLDLAKNKFITTKNNIVDSVGVDYEQLFKWSWIARYDPRMSAILGKRELDAAKNILERIKVVSINEIGYRPIPKDGKIKELSDDYIKIMQTKYQQDINI